MSPTLPDFRLLFESAPGLYLVLSPDLTIVAATDAYLRATLTHRDAIVGRPFFEAFPVSRDKSASEGLSRLRASLDRVLAGRVPDALPTQTYDVRAPGGGVEARFWDQASVPVFDPGGALAYVLHAVEDVTEGRLTRMAEAEHERRNEDLRARAGKMAAEIYVRAQQVEDANRRLREVNDELSATAQSEREAHQALRRTQSLLVQTEKLAGLGQMVAGVAHEINNPLSFVINNIAVAQRDVGGLAELTALYRRADGVLAAADPALGREIAEAAERVDLEYVLGNLGPLFERSRDGLRRIQQIVKDLRTFARLDESDLHEVDLNPGIESTANIIRGRAKRKEVELTLSLTPVPTIACYPGKVNQVVMNLLANAIDASPHGARVELRTSPGEDGGVLVEVSDDGAGIEPGIVERIFDPFFTTKAPGEGTGLGLSISYGIVQEHGGTIDVESSPGHGARFTVRLPPRPPARVSREPQAPR